LLTDWRAKDTKKLLKTSAIFRRHIRNRFWVFLGGKMTLYFGKYAPEIEINKNKTGPLIRNGPSTHN
jgi:hypothetical protein